MNKIVKTKDSYNAERQQAYQRIAERKEVIRDKKGSEEVEQKVQEYNRSILTTVHEPMLVLDADLKVISANNAFYLKFGLKPEETLRRFIFELKGQRWDISKLRELLEQILPRENPVSGLKVVHNFPDLGHKVMEISATWLPTDPEKTKLILLSVLDVTETKGVKERLSVSELRYRRLFETAQDGILILDAVTGKIIDVNPFLAEMLEYSKEEFLGKRLWEIGPFKDIELSKGAFQELQSKGYVRYEHLPLETKNGHQMSVEFVSNVYPIDDDRVIQCNIRDITDRKRVEDALETARNELETRVKERTSELAKANEELVQEIDERKQAEKALRESQERYKELAELLPQTVFEIDETGNFVFANRYGLETSGYTQQDVDKGLNALQLFIPEDRNRASENIRRIMAGERLNGIEYTAMRKDGSIFPVLTYSAPITRGGKPAGLRGLIIDITERKQAEEALEKSVEALAASEKRYKTIVESTAEGIFITDIETKRFKYANPAICRILGYSQKELEEMSIGNIHPKELLEYVVAEFESLVKGEKTISEGVPCLKKDGTIMYADVKSARALLDGTEYIVGFFTDTTEHMLAEKERKQNTEKILKAMSDTIKAMAMTVEIKDPYTSGHQEHVSSLAICIAQEMGLPAAQIEGIRIAGIIHDIGKMNVPSEILSKSGRLNISEFGLIKMHPQTGYDILKIIEFPWPIAQTVLQHHERMDGSGYPGRLPGKDIILEARILAVADVVEAISSHRPYRPALGIDKALEEISQKRGVLYDSEVVDACLKVITEKNFKFN
jgi:PAS domain S-box-containing protein